MNSGPIVFLSKTGIPLFFPFPLLFLSLPFNIFIVMVISEKSGHFKFSGEINRDRELKTWNVPGKLGRLGLLCMKLRGCGCAIWGGGGDRVRN